MDGKNDSESMKPDDADALGSDAFPDDADDFFGAVATEAGALVSEKIEREKREKAERELASFEYETHADGTYTLTGVKDKTAPRLVVPEGVVSIADNAFAGAKAMEVSLPEGLMSIGNKAFFGCKDLMKINFPDSLVSLGDEAFSGCTDLEVPRKDVRRVGRAAFAGTATERNERLEAQRLEEERKRAAEKQRLERKAAEKRAAVERDLKSFNEQLESARSELEEAKKALEEITPEFNALELEFQAKKGKNKSRKDATSKVYGWPLVIVVLAAALAFGFGFGFSPVTGEWPTVGKVLFLVFLSPLTGVLAGVVLMFVTGIVTAIISVDDDKDLQSSEYKDVKKRYDEAAGRVSSIEERINGLLEDIEYAKKDL